MVNVVYQKKSLFVDEYGPITVHEPGQLTYGEVMRFIRKWRKLSPEQIAEFYGIVASEDPVTGRHVLRMEQTDNFFPKDPNRRWILAQLVNMPAALMALVAVEPSEPLNKQKKLLGSISRSSRPLDTKEYYNTLRDYWVHGHTDETGSVIKDVKRRIDLLKDKVLLASSPEKPKMIRLLCGYFLLIADIAKEQQYYALAEQYLTDAINLAEEKKCYDLYAIAVFRREVFFDNTDNFEATLRDHEMMQQLRSPIPPQVQGTLLTVASKAQAHLAQNQKDLSTALRNMNSAENLIQPGMTEDFLFFVLFDQERYLLDVARIYTAAPTKALRRSQEADDIVTKALKQSKIKGKSVSTYRQLEYDLIQSRVYYDQGYYPVAATTAEHALTILKKLQSTVDLNKIALLLKEMKERDPFGKEVISLELELIKVQRPYLFEGTV